MSSAVSRPTGIAIMAVVSMIAGVADIAAGVGNVAFGGGFLTERFGGTLDGIMAAIGVALILVGGLGLATGIGLWQQRHWAWLITRLWAVLCIGVGVASALLSFFGQSLVSGIVATIIGALVPAIVAAVVLWYLYRPNVMAAFGRT